MFRPSTYHQSIDLHKAIIQPLPLAAGITASILRLDLIHPVISGNKWFKLKYHLQAAMEAGSKGLLTFGGAWSNHLVATAAAAAELSLPAVGIVRGERPAQLSAALQDATDAGMLLHFVSRSAYADESVLHTAMQEQFPGYYLVPQGGQSEAGVCGAADIMQLVPDAAQYTHIACAAGTGTMMAGLVEASNPQQQVLGFSSLKLSNTDDNSLASFLEARTTKHNYQFIWQYHFGGYARKTTVLTGFMNNLFQQTAIPTDIVYTGKLLYGLNDLAAGNFFPANSRLLVIHSGGLQGNRSLPAGLLDY
ncbi:1-aminocyclopropane-1-carboxylate deaminase/D-cysteine desulfhydrase [Pseudobacter ginsenosidimutans]|uniref:1-aminocyclopropane-1-carboxylate deaminase/D-cysteine desulfhydrase n=1 Tax=Pseudobacter ginsenosidimutans TaxID=661488 RepID=UPI0013156BE8|nr:pyridoxal-phosphate dependent enzyme [Pseudobacter ginsenosidimutans]